MQQRSRGGQPQGHRRRPVPGARPGRAGRPVGPASTPTMTRRSCSVTWRARSTRPSATCAVWSATIRGGGEQIVGRGRASCWPPPRSTRSSATQQSSAVSRDHLDDRGARRDRRADRRDLRGGRALRRGDPAPRRGRPHGGVSRASTPWTRSPTGSTRSAAARCPSARRARRSAGSSRSSTTSPTRPTCSRSTPRSRRPGPASTAAASRSSPPRCASSPSAPSSRPARSRPSSREIQAETNATIIASEEGAKEVRNGLEPRPRRGRRARADLRHGRRDHDRGQGDLDRDPAAALGVRPGRRRR